MITETACAKINLALYVKNRRADGYHNLETIFCTISLRDTLHFQPAPDGTLTLKIRGGDLPADNDNLVLQAARRLNAAAGTDRGARITLIKRIPVKAGLGGGSADAAASLAGLNRLWNLRLSGRKLEKLALKLGSDVPFALKRGVYLGRGRGERLFPLPGITGFFLVFVPRQGVATPWAFKYFRKYLTEKEAIVNLRRLFPQVLAGKQGWERLFYNSFTGLNLRTIPRLRAFAQAVEQYRPRGKALSGSGSAYFAYFPGRKTAARAYRELQRNFKPLFLVQPVR